MSENLAPETIGRVMKEIRQLVKNPPEGIRIRFNDENITQIYADIEGPVGTPFEGGLFQVKIKLDSSFPRRPPKGFFTTKIFHPNVASNGAICVNTLKKDWEPKLGLLHILMVIRCLLIHPNPDSALNEDAGKLLNENYDDYCQQAKLITRLYAKKKSRERKSEEKEKENIDEKNMKTSGQKKVKKGKKKKGKGGSKNTKKAKSTAKSRSLKRL